MLRSYTNQSIDLLANQLTDFYMRATLAFNELIICFWVFGSFSLQLGANIFHSLNIRGFNRVTYQKSKWTRSKMKTIQGIRGLLKVHKKVIGRSFSKESSPTFTEKLLELKRINFIQFLLKIPEKCSFCWCFYGK